jgi:hypothetical protein
VKKFLILLVLGACTQLTGDPAADCLAARNATVQAQGLASATAAVALSNPQLARMQSAAALAAANLATAQSMQLNICPAVSND